MAAPTDSAWLDGLIVLELGEGIAGASCAAIFASLGAEVHKRPAGERCVEQYRPDLQTESGHRVSILALLLDRAKQLDAEADPLPPAEIVVCDRISESAIGPPKLEDYAAWVEARNRGVWVTLSPFGLTGPYADYAGSELIASAAGGLAATIAPKEGGRPGLAPGQQGLLATGQVAALAALHGLDRQRALGRPVHVDVSAQESVTMTGALPECAHVIYACPGRAGAGRYVAPSGLFECVDGRVRIAAIDDHQWAGMKRAMGEPDWTRGLDERASRAEHAVFINAQVEHWSRPQRKAECAELLQRHGVPSTAVNGPDELRDSPQFAARGFLEPVELGGVPTRTPGRPFSWTPAHSTPSLAPEARLGLEDLHVAEFAHVLAGPIAGALLGAMGAHVVRFEDLARLDMYRRTGPFAAGVAGPERGAYFTVANHSKHSLAVDTAAQPELARQLVERSQVVLENFGPRRTRRLGVDAEQLMVERPDLLSVSLSGFGLSGPLSGYKAYANNVHAYGGLSYLTRDRDGGLVHVGSVLADPLASLTAATVIAAWALGPRRGHGGWVDLSMAEVVAGKLAEFIAEAGAGETRSLPAGSDLHPYAPHGIHPTADHRWIAIAVLSDDDWTALLDALGSPRSLAVEDWRNASARWASRRQIEDALDSLTSEHAADELFHQLQRAGVRACPVWTGAELIADPHLAARGFFPEVDHPDPELGRTRLVGLGWRFVGEGPIPLRPPPRLGEYVLDAAETPA